jgi:hypothetical protein
MSKMETMYGANRPSTLINGTRWVLNFLKEGPTQSIIEADDAITWYDSLSRLGRTRCRRARKQLACTLSQQRFALHLRSAPKFRKIWLFACAIRAKWFPWVTNRRIRHTLWTVALALHFLALDRLQGCCWAPNREGDLGSCRALSSRSMSLFECSQRVLQRCFVI